MKTLKTSLAITALAVAMTFAGISSSQAYNGYSHHDHNGYWDNHNSYHHYSSYHGHQGYWYPQPNGVRVWINI